MNNRPQKICFYILVSDTGLAPNPFHGFCTLALCTPNHMRARLEKGDWIVGCFRSGQPPKVVYVMQIEEKLSLNNYYRDPRFECKKPSKKDWKTEVGDNMYYMESNGLLQIDSKARYHLDQATQEKDKRGDRVFISSQFVYLGREATLLRPDFHGCLPATQGIKYLYVNDHRYQQFLNWATTCGKGCKSNPRDSNTPVRGNCKRRAIDF